MKCCLKTAVGGQVSVWKEDRAPSGICEVVLKIDFLVILMKMLSHCGEIVDAVIDQNYLKKNDKNVGL